MSGKKIEEFLTHLAVEENVAAATQNQVITMRFCFCITELSAYKCIKIGLKVLRSKALNVCTN